MTTTEFNEADLPELPDLPESDTPVSFSRQEIWKEIGIGAYEVSNLGRVRRHEKILKFSRDFKGYLRAHLHHDGKNKTIKVHSLVLTAFVGPRPEGLQGCHNDGNKENNALSNLRWDTPVANIADSIRHGTRAVKERHGSHKLTQEKVSEIRTAFQNKETWSASKYAQKFGVTSRAINDVVRGKTWI